jgi:hypothetical protein
VQFLVGNLERDRQVQRVASVAPLWPPKGLHLWTCALGKSTPKPLPQTGNGSGIEPRANGRCWDSNLLPQPTAGSTRTLLTARLCSARNSSARRSTKFCRSCRK